MDDTQNTIRCQLAGFSNRRIHSIIRHFQSIDQFFALPASTCRDYLRKGQYERWLNVAETDIIQYQKQLEALGATCITPASPDYPALLKEIPDAPLILYGQGDWALLQQPQIAIVGSRNMTPQGAENARCFAQYFTQHGFVVTSGLAIGIDTEAHRGALAGTGKTIAVMATGVDTIYPARNHRLAHHIKESGLLLTEWPLGVGPKPAHFPQRNRIISGLSVAVLVVEATEASGTLVTAKLALEQGREVFAIPGSIHSPVSRGCHRLIKDGATLVEKASDVVDELSSLLAFHQQNALKQSLLTDSSMDTLSDNNNNETCWLLAAMGFDFCNIEELIIRSGRSLADVQSRLLLLEMDGKVVNNMGQYQRV